MIQFSTNVVKPISLIDWAERFTNRINIVILFAGLAELADA